MLFEYYGEGSGIDDPPVSYPAAELTWTSPWFWAVWMTLYMNYEFNSQPFTANSAFYSYVKAGA